MAGGEGDRGSRQEVADTLAALPGSDHDEDAEQDDALVDEAQHGTRGCLPEAGETSVERDDAQPGDALTDRLARRRLTDEVVAQLERGEDGDGAPAVAVARRDDDEVPHPQGQQDAEMVDEEREQPLAVELATRLGPQVVCATEDRGRRAWCLRV